MKLQKGFSLVELIAGLVFIGLIAGLVALGGFSVGKNAQQRAGVTTLVAAQAEAQRIASRNPLTVASTSLQTFPETDSLVGGMEATGLTFTTNASEDNTTVSVNVIDPLSAVYAVLAGERCLYHYDRLDGVDGWAYSEGSCHAAELYGALLLNLSSDGSAPTQVAVT